MSRRAAIVEDFDDDTDLPLPSIPLPNTGSRGPLLQELNSDDDDDFEASQQAGPASPSRQQYQKSPLDSSSRAAQGDPTRQITDITPYKSWTCIYPIYLDAKRPYGTGQRRVARAKSLWWPLSKDIADAASRLGLGTLHEVNKSHPRDWENPGRVRVQWKKDGKLLNPAIPTKKALLEMVCFQIQHLKPENIPKPPYNTTGANVAPAEASPVPPPASNKGKQPAAAKSKTPTAPPPSQSSGRRLPVPPEPQPSLAERVSPYSPAISAGVLIETVKAGMNATESGPPSAPAGMAKGKKKVIRVRG
ncbi:hypothetical protein CVT24_011453 [Panaeolus cyanescens]|uniref:Signal recognition particle SRP19 subunit n=1 Tax=Panaeolus cyanescens TaxID=181874 RepID=A0A409YGX8_9AGAR|nr:hypothetical protein CVT24_011453 [Panaeolus cyanescens]